MVETDIITELNLYEKKEEVSLSDNWVVYRDRPSNYTLFLNFACVNMHTGWKQLLPRYRICSDNDNIQKKVTGDICEVRTDNYLYVFKRGEKWRETIRNNLSGGSYTPFDIECLQVQKIKGLKRADVPEHYIQLDEGTDILSYYHNGDYQWSKIICKKYTEGVYFILRDKIFAVIRNGLGVVNIFNFDGSDYSKFSPGYMEYIERYVIDGEYLRFYGFIWGPEFLTASVKIDSIFSERPEAVYKFDDVTTDEEEENES